MACCIIAVAQKALICTVSADHKSFRILGKMLCRICGYVIRNNDLIRNILRVL